MQKNNLFLVLLVSAGLISCAPPRTSPATQPKSPASFDVAKSDAKAIEVADKVFAAVGGANWANAKEIRWTHEITIDDKIMLEYQHSWDRWNGRHNGRTRDRSSFLTTVQDLYTGFGDAHLESAARQRLPNDVSRADQNEMKAAGRKRWIADSYMLCMPFKLKDPGVILKYVGERHDDAGAVKFEEITVTFAAGVEGVPANVIHVIVDNQTWLIERVEIIRPGKDGNPGPANGPRLTYKWSDWKEVAGLKFSTVRQNAGFAETVRFLQIEISDLPNETLYNFGFQ